MVTHAAPNQAFLAAVAALPSSPPKHLPPVTTISFPASGGHLSMESLDLHAAARKEKVVIVMGATGTGKSRLSLDLAARFPAEVVNSDKMQLYRGLDVVTNKITDEERGGVPHHLLGVLDPDANFSAAEFRMHASRIVEWVHWRGRLPIVAGGSNSYIKALVEGDNRRFRSRYQCCFLWVDVGLPELHSFVSERVDRMVEAGLVEEVRGVFRPDGDYSSGIRRAIGVPEMDAYFRAGLEADEATKTRLLRSAIEDIKTNTCNLACRQLQKIHRLARSGWEVHRLDATDAFRRRRDGGGDEAWEKLVARPGVQIVRSFLVHGDDDGDRRDVDQQGRGSNSGCDGVAKYRCIAIDVSGGGNRSTKATAAACTFY